MRWLVVGCGVLLGACTTDVVHLPGQCEVSALRQRITIGFEPRARLLALVDEGAPPDAVERIEATADILRSGDLDGDGMAEIAPFESVDVVVRVGALETPIAPVVAEEVPSGYGADATRLIVAIVTSGDIPAAVVEEADELASLRGRSWRFALAGVAGTGDDPSCAPPAAELARLVSELDALGIDAAMVSLCDPAWERSLARASLGLAELDALHGSCLPYEPDVLEDGRRACTLYETFDPEAPFDCSAPGRVADPTPREPRRCRVVQRVPEGDAVPTEPGWFWDDLTDPLAAGCGGIGFSGGLELAAGSRVELVCVRQTGDCGVAD